MAKVKRTKMTRRPKRIGRTKPSVKFQLEETDVIDYKNIALLQKFVTDRGKVLPRRLTMVTAKQQRAIRAAVKQASLLALLPISGAKKA